MRYAYQFLFRVVQAGLGSKELCEPVAGLCISVCIWSRKLRCKGSAGITQDCRDLLSDWPLPLQLFEKVVPFIPVCIQLRGGCVGHVASGVDREEVDVGRPLERKTGHLYLGWTVMVDNGRVHGDRERFDRKATQGEASKVVSVVQAETKLSFDRTRVVAQVEMWWQRTRTTKQPQRVDPLPRPHSLALYQVRLVLFRSKRFLPKPSINLENLVHVCLTCENACIWPICTLNASLTRGNGQGVSL